MQFNFLNKIENQILEITKAIGKKYFEDVNIEVGIFQSPLHNLLTWTENGHMNATPAIVIPKEDFVFLKRDVPEIEETSGSFKNKLTVIIWLGKKLLNIPTIDPTHLLAHELRHVSQLKMDKNILAKDRILSFILSNKYIPSEVDANNFADMVLGYKFETKYDWILKTNELFNKNEKKLFKIYEDIIDNKDEIVVEGCRHEEFSNRESKRMLFKYYFERAVGSI